MIYLRVCVPYEHTIICLMSTPGTKRSSLCLLLVLHDYLMIFSIKEINENVILSWFRETELRPKVPPMNAKILPMPQPMEHTRIRIENFDLTLNLL